MRPHVERRTPGLALGANDGPVDDFIALVEQWEESTGNSLMSPGRPVVEGEAETRAGRTPPANAPDLGGVSPAVLRQIAAQLEALADGLEGQPPAAAAARTPGPAGLFDHIERHALPLAKVAIAMRTAANRRSVHLAPEFFGEPAWEMLLELFVRFAEGVLISTKSLTIASGASETTAHRLIDRLEDACLISRSPSTVDRRVTLIGLTRQGVIAVGSILMDRSAS